MSSILLTGFTGFIGKVLVLDILRSMNISKIYLLIRDRGELSARSRYLKITQNKHLKNIFSKYLNFIEIISGDLSKDNLGISDENIKILNKEVNIVINCAASIEFNEPIKIAMKNNVQTVINLIDFIDKKLEISKFIHISTLYVNPPNNNTDNLIKREIINLPLTVDKLIDLINKGSDLSVVNTLLGTNYPNTYCLTKCIGELIIHSNQSKYTKCIVRPSIVSNSISYPFPGWTDSYAAYNAFNLTVGTGLIKNISVKADIEMNIIPVDYVTSLIVNCLKNSTTDNFNIYHACMNSENMPTSKYCSKGFQVYRLFNYSPQIIFHETADSIFKMRNFLEDYVPYKLGGIMFNLIGNKKSASKCKLVADKLSNINEIFYHFTHNSWHCELDPYAENYNSKFNKELYHSFIIPFGMLNYILDKQVDKFAILNKRNKGWDFTWGYNHSQNKSLLTISSGIFLRKVFSRLFNNIYVDIQKIILTINKIEGNILICPNHRTYCDFLLVSYLLMELSAAGIKLPRIAAAQEFSKIPLIGDLFKELGCFFVERDARDYSLNKKVSDILEDGDNIEFFIEGTRSRTRESLPFKSGLVKCIQQTNKKFTILPIVFSYEKVPEQEVLLKEIMSNYKPGMNLYDLLFWSNGLFGKGYNLGDVHIKCGDSVNLNPDDDPKVVLRKVMRQHQLNSVATTYHFKFSTDLENIKLSTLDSDFHKSSLEEWVCMNQWIHKYLTISKINNFWENKYITTYNYLEEKDKIRHPNTLQYQRVYFKNINRDIEMILAYLVKHNRLIISNILKDIDLVLGSTMIKFVIKVLKEDKKIDEKHNLIDKLDEKYLKLY